MTFFITNPFKDATTVSLMVWEGPLLGFKSEDIIVSSIDRCTDSIRSEFKQDTAQGINALIIRREGDLLVSDAMADLEVLLEGFITHRN